MYYAAILIAATLIAQPILLPASISTFTTGQVSYPGGNVSCTDFGQTSSACAVEYHAPQPFMPGGTGETSISGDWNIAQTSYAIHQDFPCCAVASITTTARWSVTDTITITGNSGRAVLFVRFAGGRTDEQGADYAVFVNNMSFPAGNGIWPASGFEVPFTFGEPVQLTFGAIANGQYKGEFDWWNSATFALMPPTVYRSSSMSGQGVDPIFDFQVTRESGASFGTPEPGTLTLCAAALGLVVIARRPK